MDSTAVAAVYISMAVFATTIQAQDFKDVDGDKYIGRKTLPLLFPSSARETLFTVLIGWSIFLPLFWQLTPIVTGPFMALSGYVGWRYVMLRTSVEVDQVSFYWYNVSKTVCSSCTTHHSMHEKVWLSFVHALPAFHRVLA